MDQSIKLPKITIVTPNYNLGEYLEQTILSILNQNYPNLEYIIIDGGSTDNSLEIIKKYEEKLTYWVSEPDNGMYEAIQKGFDKSTGDIMGWLNSDDMLHPNSLFYIAQIFGLSKEIEWIQGRPTVIDENGGIFHVSEIKLWNVQKLFVTHFTNEYIQQESTFWTKKLWKKAGAAISNDLKYAGDFELWLRFSNYSKLFSTNLVLGSFRFWSKNQTSLNNNNAYRHEIRLIIKKELNNKSIFVKTNVNFFLISYYFLQLLSYVKIFNIPYLSNQLLPRIFGASKLIEIKPKLKK